MSVEVVHARGAVVVTLHDPAEPTVVAPLVARVADDPRTAVVIDMSFMTMAPTNGVASLVGHIHEAASSVGSHRWCLVANRSTARRILRHLCADTTIGVFSSVDTALAALTGQR